MLQWHKVISVIGRYWPLSGLTFHRVVCLQLETCESESVSESVTCQDNQVGRWADTLLIFSFSITQRSVGFNVHGRGDLRLVKYTCGNSADLSKLWLRHKQLQRLIFLFIFLPLLHEWQLKQIHMQVPSTLFSLQKDSKWIYKAVISHPVTISFLLLSYHQVSIQFTQLDTWSAWVFIRH